MNVLPSLLVYNPLENIIFLYFLNYISIYKINIKNMIINSYILGFITLLLQYIVEIFYGSFIYSVMSLVNNFIFLPLVIYLYQFYVIRFKISLSYIYLYNNIYILSSLLILLYINNNIYLNIFENNFIYLNELLLNIIVRTSQIIILFGIIYIRRWILNERNVKENSK